GLAAAERRSSVGAATRSDVLRATLELNQARQAELEARTQRRTAAFALGRTVGIDGAVGARLEDSLDTGELAMTREELIADVEAAAPAVRAASASATAADAAVRSARSRYLPSLSFTAGTDWFNQDPALSGGRSSWSLRLGMSFPLFDRFQREEQVATSRIQAEVAEAQLRDARLAARAEVERLIATLELAEQQLELAREAADVAREDLRVQEERYRLGAATILDRITSQVALDEAEQALVAARYDYQIARAELEALVGREL
ncbi:MAG: TolC family protein, partial [Gemmatimonadota bacterium]